MKTFTLRNLRNLRSIGTIAFIAFAMLMFNNSAFSQCFVTFTTVDASSINSNDGSATAYPDSMVSPVSYLWDAQANNQTTQIASNLGPGVYCVTVTDANGCIATGCATIGVNSGSGCWVVLSATDATCSTCADGSATAMPDSTFTGPFVYLWDDPSAQTTSLATGLLPGTYCVAMMDTAGCIATGCVTISANSGSGCWVGLSATDATCSLCADGSATVYPDSMISPVSYLWDAQANNQTTQTASNLGPGVYCVTVTDANGCIATGCVTVSVNSGSGCWVVLSATDATCSTCADGSATAMPDSTFTGPFVYLWDDPSAQTTSLATGLLPGTYCVTMTDTAGCIATGCVVVGPNTPSSCSANFYPYVDSSQTNLVYLIENSSGNGLSYYWDFDDGSTSTQQFPTHVYTSYGTFNICLTVSDTGNCIDTYCISLLLDSVQKTGSGGYTVIVVPDVPVTGIENSISIDLKTIVYPNPASSEVYVELTGWSNSVTITLFNVVGQKLSREVVSLDTGQNTVTLDLNDYSAGLYFIQVDSEKNREIKRISISE